MIVRVEVYKCYLVEVVDDEKGILFSEYQFTDRKDAIRIGKEEKERLIKQLQREQEEDDEL